MNNNIRAIDLFAGCGGMTAGFKNVGFDIVAAFENWEPAIKCYSKNFTHRIFSLDLSDLDTAIAVIKEINHEIIIGGPPCQDFSHAGKRLEGKRANLTIVFADIVSHIKPKWFVMENVDRIQTSYSYKIAKEMLKEENYGLTEIVLDASHCGVPQKRKRFFCIGMIDGSDDFLKDELISRQTKKQMTMRDYFGSSLGLDYYYRHPRNYNRRAIFSLDETSPTIRGVNRPVPIGYPGHQNDPIPLNSDIRPLTTLERARVQTFPESYIWEGTKTDLEQMIGNAVPVKLAEFVASILYDFIEGDNHG